MDNVLETNGVPLTVFGGAVPELAPEDLPEGASPFNQDVDYVPGSVFTRGGRQNQYTFANQTILRNPALGQSLPGAFAPNETAWQNPNNITFDVPATPAVAALNTAAPQTPILGTPQTQTFGSLPATWTVNTNATNAYAWFTANEGGGWNAGAGWNPGPFGGGIDQAQYIVGGTATVNLTTAASPIFNGVLVAWQADGHAIVKIQQPGGASGTTQVSVTFVQFLSVGTTLVCAVATSNTTNPSGGAQLAWDPSQSGITDTSGNNWIFVGSSQGAISFVGMSGCGVWYCSNPVPNTKPIVTITLKALGTILNCGNIAPNIAEIAHMLCFGIYGPIDQTASVSGSGNGFTIGPIVPTFPNSTAFLFVCQASNNTFPPAMPVGFGTWVGQTGIATYGDIMISCITGSTSATLSWGGAASQYAAILLDLPNSGPIAPYPWQVADNSNSSFPSTPPTSTMTFGANVTAGNMIIVAAYCSNTTSAPLSVSITDSLLNTYQVRQAGGASNGNAFVAVGIAERITGGACTVTITVTGTGNSTVCEMYECAMGAVPPNNTSVSQVLTGSQYVSLPSTTAIIGMQVLVSGNQTSAAPGSTIQVTLNQTGAQVFTAQLPSANGTIVLGTPTSNWGLVLTPATFSPTFAVQLVASSNVTDIVSVYGLQIKLYVISNATNFNWIKTYQQTDAEIDTLALDANGVLWDEDVDSNPTVLNSIFNTILPNTFAKSVTFSDIEFIAFSNLVNGTDCPRQWNGTNLDRVSMVGPGGPCNATVTGGSGGSNTTPIQNITQAPPVQIRRIAWGASINAQSDSTPGNVLVVSLPGGSTHGGNPPLNMNPGDTIVLSNITNPFPKKGGGSIPFNINGTYTLQQSGTPIIGGGETDTAFTLQAPGVAYGYSNDFGVPPTSGWFYQDTVATVTLQAPLPNVGVGNTITITGTGGGPPGGYDGTWTVLSSPNAVSMTISSVILVGGVATYSFLLIPPSPAPVPGQLVSTANVLNGNPAGPPGIFNVQNAQIQSVSANTFTINISNPDLTPAQSQLGNVPPATAQVAGTIFKFDPAQIVNSGNPVSGGNVVSAGLIATGQRKVCYSFLTRTGFITQPSPISTFNITSGAGSITVSGLSPGPPNVIARIVFFTGANGGNFFYIPQEVDVTIPGQPIQKNFSTIVNDNTSTTATFSFSDAVLLSATAIDIPGNNLFNCIELGSCRGFLTYASRLVAWSEQQKVTNLRNLSFDGGYNPATNEPLGWNPDSTSGAGGSIGFNSPVFGWIYQIINNTGGTQSAYGMITQGAYQDEFGVPIIQVSTLYSVRICALCQPQPQSGGNLVVDLFSAQTGGGTVLGSFSIPLASMTTTMQIYTGTLLTNAFVQKVPTDLVIRIWAQNIAAGAQILIDRVEPFATLAPVNTTAFKMSYVGNQESFDLITGVCGPNQNMQPINGGMVLFDLLYALKERSWYSTFDNGVTEPNKWNWKEVSNKVGTVGIHSYDWGEGWALSANREGVFFFEGGEPIKVSQEIQPLWDSINWQYGYTIWTRNDPEQRRFTVGIPIPTPNQWMPEFPVNANPTSPNVVLMCNYRELNTGAAIAQTGPIRSTYMGRLMSPEPARKWSFWNIRCPYSDYISRANLNWPQFFCTGYGDSKIFALQASQLSDDGAAINSFWISYGFVKPEMQDAKGLGLFRMEFPYFTVLAVGSGTLNSYVYPESPFNQPYVLDPTPLPALTQGDLEIGVNVKGQRFFVRIGTNAVGSWFRCSKMVVPLLPDSWSPIRGYNAVTA